MRSLSNRVWAPIILVAAGLALSGFVAARWSAGQASVTRVDPLAGSASAFPDLSRTWLTEWADAGAEERSRQLAQLGPGLAEGEPVRATRAATLVGAVLGHESATENERDLCHGLLTERLSLRVDTGERWSVGADVVSARALDGLKDESAQRRSAALAVLVPLATGEPAHPNLAVRVECAASALALLRRESEPSVAAMDQALTGFLLAVLRAETPAQELSPRSWPRITTLAWVKTRAADALAQRTGLENLFRPDGSWAHQVDEAARFAARL